MNYIEIGKIYTTHGLNGELKVKSFFKYKDNIYKENFIFYCGNKKEKLTLKKFRKQNDLDLLTFNEIDNIDKGILYRGQYLYINRQDLNVNIIDNDIIGYKCLYRNNNIGILSSITDEGHGNEILRIKTNEKEIPIPYNNNFVSKIDKNSAIIEFINLEGLL